MKLNEVLASLGGEFKEMRISGNIAFNRTQKLCFRYSKFYDDSQVWWTSEIPERLKESDSIIIALEKKGILIIPSKVIWEYWTKYNVGMLKNGGRKIRLKNIKGNISLFNNSGDPTINIEKYLVKKWD